MAGRLTPNCQVDWQVCELISSCSVETLPLLVMSFLHSAILVVSTNHTATLALLPTMTPTLLGVAVLLLDILAAATNGMTSGLAKMSACILCESCCDLTCMVADVAEAMRIS
jgi:hypothetical protein